MVVKQILFFFCCVMLFMRCDSNQTPTIRAICVRDNIGNYIIKWETDPQMEGKMKLYVSDTPDAFNLSAPCAYADIQEGIVTYITDDNISRKYFLLSFNDNYFRTIGARFVQMDGIQNLRDIGGYFDRKRQHMTQWGKVYRSGVIRALSSNDKIRMKNLNIKTIIDLRGDDERKRMPEQPTDANVISIPIPIKEKDLISRRLKEGQIRKGDGFVYMQDTYLRYVTEDSAQFSKALKVFLDRDNYPILNNCSLGKDRVGFLTAMLLAALDVPEETIINDYMASNDYINLEHFAYMGRELNTDAQETITVMLHANERWMELVFRKIKKEYGSINNYLSKGLHISDKDRETLKEIMLD